MKRIIFVLIATLLLSFFTNEAKAQCPTGWQSQMFIAEYAPGCSYIITFCYKCDGFGPALGASIKNIQMQPYDPQNSNCDPEDYYLDQWIIDQVINKFSDLCTIPPCNEQSITITLEHPICKKWVNDVWQNSDGTWGHIEYKQYCWDYLCVTTYLRCFDPVNGGFIDMIQSGPIASGIPCSDTETIDHTTQLDYIEWELPCFIDYNCSVE